MVTSAKAQLRDNRYSSSKSITTCQIYLDHKFVLNSSVVVKLEGEVVKNNQYKVIDHTLQLEEPFCTLNKNKTIDISYRFLDLSPTYHYSLLDSSRIQTKNDDIVYIAYDLSPEAMAVSNNIFNNNALDYTGTFSKGFSLGNAQNLVFDSKFDMQLEGEIGNGIRINAAISDENIPIQAEGNTQVLQEFDRVFIQLSKGQTNVVAGDYVIQRPNAYFMNYYKKLKGLGIKTSFKEKKHFIHTEANVATSRGKFARQTLVNKEGNQGPYKLTGANNERYLIVLSGTEKIFFNGQLLQRGQENDYTIDYNLAEITFSPNRLVAKESRIIVEYEYTDLNYFRTLYTFNNNYLWKNTSVSFNFYSEQDSKKSTGQIQLDSTTLEILKIPVTMNPLIPFQPSEKPMMRTSMRSNINICQTLTTQWTKMNIFLNMKTTQQRHCTFLPFSEVGENKGSYVIDQSLAVNGRVYKFVGQNKGNYDPVTKLVPPEKKTNVCCYCKTESR